MTGALRLCSAWVVYPLLTAAVAVCPGCRDDDNSVKVQTLDGKIEKTEVNPDGTGKITVLYFNEKRNQDVLGTALVTRETEIMINGALATLNDIREGERVRGDVRIDKKHGQRILTAVKIHIDRPKPVGGEG